MRSHLSAALAGLCAWAAAPAGADVLLVSNSQFQGVSAYDFATKTPLPDFVPASTANSIGWRSAYNLTLNGGSVYGSNFNYGFPGPTPAGILKFDAATGAPQGVFTSGGGIQNASGFAFVGPNLLVADLFLNKVLSFNATTGVYQGDFATGFSSPTVVKTFGTGVNQVVYVGNGGGSGLRRYDASGTLLNTLNVAAPTDVAIDANGIVYVSQGFGSAIQRFDGNNSFASMAAITDTSPTPLFDGTATHLEIGPDGNLYLSEFNTPNPDILKYDMSTGAFSVFVNTPAIAGPEGTSGPLSFTFVPSPVPEPAVVMLVLLPAALLLLRFLRRPQPV